MRVNNVKRRTKFYRIMSKGSKITLITLKSSRYKELLKVSEETCQEMVLKARKMKVNKELMYKPRLR